ncbi:MAG: hypothetical protein OEM02_03765 [Desulfobulbaceae bacterium]|nr:hypothetical protein [Desulfobulbaceae bacterium]
MKYTSVVLAILAVVLFAIPVFASNSEALEVGVNQEIQVSLSQIIHDRTIQTPPESSREIQITFPQDVEKIRAENNAQADLENIEKLRCSLLLISIIFMLVASASVVIGVFYLVRGKRDIAINYYYCFWGSLFLSAFLIMSSIVLA